MKSPLTPLQQLPPASLKLLQQDRGQLVHIAMLRARARHGARTRTRTFFGDFSMELDGIWMGISSDLFGFY